MSVASETVPPPATAPAPAPASAPVEVDDRPQTQTTAPTFTDVIMWRRKYMSILVLSVATATWAALQVYQFHFLTLASWVAMFFVAVLFFGGSIYRLLGKESPEFSGMEISEKTAVEMANEIREWVEGGGRWMFRVSSPSSKREGLVFGATVTSIWLLSLIGNHFDLLTLVYAAFLASMSVPAIYINYEEKLKEYGWRWRLKSQKCYQVVEDKVRALKIKVEATTKKKSKKLE